MHPVRGPHQYKHAIAGVRSSSGQYLSTLTAEIKHCAFKVSTQFEVRNPRKPITAFTAPRALAGMRWSWYAFNCRPLHPSTKPPAHDSSTSLAALARRAKTHPKNSSPCGLQERIPPSLGTTVRGGSTDRVPRHEHAMPIRLGTRRRTTVPPVTIACPSNGIR